MIYILVCVGYSVLPYDDSSHHIFLTLTSFPSLGTTDVMRPVQFVEETGRLRLPAEPIKSIITPYTPPSPPATKSSTILQHMPHLNASSSHLSLNSLSIRSGGTSSPAEKSSEEKVEKKKKKGLKKLFG